MLTFNRKLLLTLTSIIAITIMPACKHDSKEINELLKIEKLNESDPKAALELIDSIQPEKYNTPKLKALYSLVKSQALDKNLILLNSDSIISVARQYYEDSPDKYHRMKSEYYYGMINLNSEKLDTALLAFLKAYDLGEEIKDYFWQGMSASRIAEIFNNNKDGQQELEFSKIALNCLNKTHKEQYINYAILDLGTAYHNVNYTDSCILIIKNLLETSRRNQDHALESAAQELLGAAYLKCNKYQSVLDILQNNSRHENVSPLIIAYMAIAHLGLGNFEEGKHLILKLENDSTLISDYLKYDLYRKLNDKDKALTALEEAYGKIDDKFDSHVTSKLSLSILKYHRTQQLLDKANVVRYKSRVIFIAIASVLLITIIILTFLYYSQKQKFKNQELATSAKNLNDRLLTINESNKKLAKSIFSLLSTQFIGINEACQTLFESENEDKAKKQIASNMLKLIQSISEDESTIIELEKLIDHHCDNILSKFKSDFSDLKTDDHRLFLYSALGFDNVAISRFFNTTVKGIYNRRDKIKNRVLNSEIKEKDKDHYIAILYPQGLKLKTDGTIGKNQNLYKPNIKIKY